MKKEDCFLSKKLTVLVNSCDSYEDLWVPFFTLFLKYWNCVNVRILLNTESKDFSFDGLDIEVIHYPKENSSYGERMLNCLSSINTPYVLFLLDDFFLRAPVNTEQISRIINWMDKDKSIVSFSCNVNNTYYDWENEKYPGFRRVPWGNPYTLTMQAGIWRINKLKKYWRPKISPWEWEEYCNLLTTFHHNDKFYMSNYKSSRFCEYGYDGAWMGVYHGKWVVEDVEPLFKKEGIAVDYRKRGIYKYEEGLFHMENAIELDEKDIIKRCLGVRGIIGNILFDLLYPIIPIIYEPFMGGYLSFLKYRAQVKFCKKFNCNVVHVVTKKELLARLNNRIKKRGD